MAGTLKTEISELADVALQAAERERDYRASLAARGRRTVRKGVLIGGAATAGILLVSVLRRNRDDDDRRRDSRGVLERAGDHFLTVMRWGVTASHLWALAFSPQPPAADTLPDV